MEAVVSSKEDVRVVQESLGFEDGEDFGDHFIHREQSSPPVNERRSCAARLRNGGVKGEYLFL